MISMKECYMMTKSMTKCHMISMLMHIAFSLAGFHSVGLIHDVSPVVVVVVVRHPSCWVLLSSQPVAKGRALGRLLRCAPPLRR